AAAAVLAVGATIWAVGESRLSRERLRGEVQIEMARGRGAEWADNPDLAAAHYATAERLASRDAALGRLASDARRGLSQAVRTRQMRQAAKDLFDASDRLRFGLLGLAGSP